MAASTTTKGQARILIADDEAAIANGLSAILNDAGYEVEVASDGQKALERLQSDEGPALGAAVTALAALETHLRKSKRIREPFTVGDAVPIMVKFKKPVEPNPGWREAYQRGLQHFMEKVRG